MPALANFRIILNKIRWLLSEKLSASWDYALLVLSIPPNIHLNNIRNNEKFIVYVGENLPPRIPRMAKWTKRLGGFKSLLICHKHGFHEKFSNSDIDCIILFRNKWHLKRIIRELPAPYIIHAFAPKSRYPYFAMKFFKKHHPNVPFVADYQDVLSIYYGATPKQRWLKRELPYEKLCMQQANGIVAHSLELCEGMKLWGIKEKKRRLFFPIYCDNDFFFTQSEEYSSNNVHIVYAGGIAGSHRDKRHYGAVQLHWLISYLTQQKIHFHIYPSPSVQKVDYEEYEKIAEVNQYFHMHKAVSQSSLSKELSKYHYGTMPFFKESTKQSNTKLKYATTLKLFNYLEAGLPILVGAGVAYQGWLVERYHSGFIIEKMEDFKNLHNIIEKTPYNTQTNNVTLNREKLSLKKHGPRLVEFYKTLNNSL